MFSNTSIIRLLGSNLSSDRAALMGWSHTVFASLTAPWQWFRETRLHNGSDHAGVKHQRLVRSPSCPGHRCVIMKIPNHWTHSRFCDCWCAESTAGKCLGGFPLFPPFLTRLLWPEQTQGVNPGEWVLQCWLCSAPTPHHRGLSLLLTCCLAPGSRAGGAPICPILLSRQVLGRSGWAPKHSSVPRSHQSHSPVTDLLGVSGWTDPALFSAPEGACSPLGEAYAALSSWDGRWKLSIYVSDNTMIFSFLTLLTLQHRGLQTENTVRAFTKSTLWSQPYSLYVPVKTGTKTLQFNILLHTVTKAGDFSVQKEEISYFLELP